MRTSIIKYKTATLQHETSTKLWSLPDKVFQEKYPLTNSAKRDSFLRNLKYAVDKTLPGLTTTIRITLLNKTPNINNPICES